MGEKIDVGHERPSLTKRIKGVTTQDKGVYVPPENREPNDFQNLHRSKAQFIENQKLKAEKAQKMSEFSKQLDEQSKQKKEVKEQDLEQQEPGNVEGPEKKPKKKSKKA